MKLLISALGLAICTPVFASDKLSEITGYLLNNIELKQNQNFSNLVCGTGGCSVDLIEDSMVASTTYITEEYNPAANTLKIKFSEDNKLLNTHTDTFLVCLDNASSPDKCKFFTQDKIASMNYAFENGEFLKGRNKRNTGVKVIVGAILAPLAYNRLDRVYSGVNDDIDKGLVKGWEWVKRETTTMNENWHEMNRQREKYETRIDRSDRGDRNRGGDRDRGGSSGGNRERFDRSRW